MKAEKSQVTHPANEENDFIDFIVAATVSTAVFMGIFIIATVVALLV